jgi:hypothetical protein
MPLSTEELKKSLKYTIEWELNHPEGSDPATVSQLFVRHFNLLSHWDRVAEHCSETTTVVEAATRYADARRKWVGKNFWWSDMNGEDEGEKAELKSDYAKSLNDFLSVIQQSQGLSCIDDVSGWRESVVGERVTLASLAEEEKARRKKWDEELEASFNDVYGEEEGAKIMARIRRTREADTDDEEEEDDEDDEELEEEEDNEDGDEHDNLKA